MRNPLLVPDLRELLQAGESAALREFFEDMHPGRVAEVLEDLEPSEADAIFGLLPARLRAEVISYLPPDRQVETVERMSPADAAALLRLMAHDDRADLVNRLDEDHVDQILRRMAHAEREDIRRLASYEPGTAGAVMTTDYATLPPDITVREAREQLRLEAPERETIDYSYVIDARRKLLGIVSLKDLFLARPRARVEEIMKKDIIFARVDEDQESVARKIDRYDLFAIPVVDANDMLVGIVTHDDAMDILRREQTEDLLAFGGVSAAAEAEETPYWEGSTMLAVRRRIVWLLPLFLAGTVTQFVIHWHDWVDKLFPQIDFDAFIPLLIGTGGNAASQTVGTIIRGLALGEIQRGDTWRVLGRELQTGLLLGALLGSLGVIFTALLGHSATFAAVIGLALLGICIWANCIGALVPLLARRIGWDPALVSAPFISTVVDATGLFIFYRIAILLLTRFAVR
jgi:magnesium transporter